MKKRFTRIMAAMMLLVTFAIPMGMRGQTRTVSNLTFTAACDGSGTADDGAVYTITSDAAESTFDNTKGIHYGTSKAAVSYLNLSTSDISGTITEIKVNASGASGTSAKLNVTVGGSAFGTEKSLTSTATEYTFTGSASGNIVVAITQTSAKKALYCKSIVVTYTPAGSTETTITITVPQDLITDVYQQSTNAGTLTATVSANNTPISGATVTWTSSNTNVATIGETTGVVTLVAAGSTTITANYAGVTGQYASSSATYKLTVSDSTPFTGGDVTFDATKDKDLENTTQGEGSITKLGVTFACDNGILGNGSEYRMYKNSVTTFSVSEGTITQIAFTGVSGNPASGFATQTGWTTNGNNGTWTGNSQEVSFTASGAQVRATLIVVTVDLGGTPAPSITASDVDITYDATSGEIGYSIINPVANATLNATTTANWLTIGTVGSANIPFTCSANQENAVRTATVTLSYVNGDETLATKDVTVTQAAAPLVYTTIPSLFEAATSTSTSVTVNFGSWVVSGVNGNQSFVTDGTNGFIMYQSGHGFEVGNVLSGTANCNLVLFHSSAEITGLTSTSEGLTVGNNGSVTPVVTTIDALQAVNTGSVVTLSNLTYNGTNLSDGTNNIQYYTSLYNGTTLESGKIYNITGIFVLYDDTKRILPRNDADIEEVISTTPVINASDIEITYNATSGEIAYTIDNPVDGQNLTATTTADWITIGTVGSTNVPFTCSTNEGDSDRTATVTLSYNGAEDKEITVTQGHYVAPITGNKYVKVTSTTDLISGQYLIVYEGGNVAFDGSLETLDAVGNTISVTISNNEIASTNFTVAAEFTINKTAGTIKSASGYYIGQTSDANGLQSNTATAYTNTISFDEDGNANIISEGGAYLRYNSNSDQTRFRYFKSATYTSQKAIQLYKKVEPIDLTVSGYGDSEFGGYHLIASPIMESVSPTAVTNMIDATSANYDLYRFNQDADYEWQNYKHHTDGFVIEPGKAYLYAHNTDVTLTFNGTAYNGNGTFTLTQSTTNTSNGGKMNVLGNPFNATVNLGGRSYYKMNADGSELEPIVGGSNDDIIGAYEGIMVQYNAENPSVTFSTSKSREDIELLTLNLKKQDNDIDRVIVRFDGGDQLYKYQIFGGSNIYVPQDDQNYAIVNGNSQGTLPINFKATANGTYTLNIDTENVAFSTLMLHDNLTGADINLLAKATYSFEATTSDEETRFTLTYSKAIPTFEKTIAAYTDNSGYYLIASPVGNDLGLTPATEVTNLVDGSFDLYMFDQTGDDDGKQWLNYKASAFSYLEVGMGYLYASESDVTLTFSGTPISSDDDYAVEVNYNASSDFPGLNLLGNPFAEEAYLVNAEGNGLAYHRLNPANNTYVTVDDNSAIPMMEGVFYEAGENDVVVYFSATAPATSKSNLNITVSQGRGMVDNAIVRFGEGNTLRKITLRDNSTKVYIPQNGSEYALVNANEFGEMPVNFKAENNGTYTMSFSNQNVEFGYLHLIDNLTGADVDLLANPSYSFEAKVSDYASRFKLVFATGNDDSSSDFAFVSNDEIIVNGEGMLQVIDMTGRIISTSQVNGMSSIKLNAAAGVYVLRLNDKTQKIVIR